MNQSEAAKYLGIKNLSLYNAYWRGAIPATITPQGFEYDIKDLRLYKSIQVQRKINREERKLRIENLSRLNTDLMDPPETKKFAEKTLYKCRSCGEWKLYLYQYHSCSECLKPKLKKFTDIINAVRGA